MEIKTKITKMLAMIHDINDQAINGEIDSLESFIYLDRFKKQLDDVIKGLKDDAISEAEKQGDKTFDLNGSTVTVKSAGGGWDFKGCPSWVDKKSELTHIEHDLKSAYDAHEKGWNVVSDDGELAEIPTKRHGVPTLSIKHPKS
jgi:hypothetical protein